MTDFWNTNGVNFWGGATAPQEFARKEYTKKGQLLSQSAIEAVGFPSSEEAYFPTVIDLGYLTDKYGFTPHSSLSGYRFLMMFSENHGSVGGCWQAVANAPEGPWTVLDQGGDEGQVVEYTGTGNGQETPELYFDEKGNKLMLLSHNQSMGRTQSTYLMESTDGVTWSVGSTLRVLDTPAIMAGTGHTGYARHHRRPNGEHVLLGLVSDTDNSRRVIWESKNGTKWHTHNKMQTINADAFNVTTEDYALTVFDIVYFNGYKYGICGNAEAIAAGGVTATGTLELWLMGKSDTQPISRVCSVPRGGSGEFDENGFISPCLQVLDGRLVSYYLGKNASDAGTIGAVEFN